jgi:hypothetical protein
MYAPASFIGRPGRLVEGTLSASARLKVRLKV